MMERKELCAIHGFRLRIAMQRLKWPATTVHGRNHGPELAER
jgi:hypothetical protein